MTDGPLLVVVDDNPGDIELIQVAFAIAEIRHVLMPAAGGQEAIDLLARLEHEGRRPHLILLDLSMPRIDGFAVLEAMGATFLNEVPVIVLSSSGAPADRERAIRLGAHAFVSKPQSLDELLVVVEMFRPHLRAERTDAR